jgi:hypothetical protein
MMLTRVTWQLSRRQKVNPGAGSGQTSPTFPQIVVGSWIGSWSPLTSVITELSAGAPLVGIDIVAFLPAEAGTILAEGDTLLRLEDATRWQVMRTGRFATRTVAMLARATEKKVIGA